MEHVKQLRATCGTIMKATCALHKIWICGREIFVRSVARAIADEPCRAAAPKGPAQQAKTTIFLEKRKQKASRNFRQKLSEKFAHDIRENELIKNELM